MIRYQVYKSTPKDRDIYRPPMLCETHIREIAEAVVDYVFRQMTEGCVYIEKVEGDTAKIVSWRDTGSEVRNETYH